MEGCESDDRQVQRSGARQDDGLGGRQKCNH